MYDILTNIFKNPGNAFSPLPLWYLNAKITPEEALRQLSEFHIKGVNGVVVCPRMGFDPEIDYLSEKYMNLMEQIAATAAKKRMLLVFNDEAMGPTGSAHGNVVRANPLFAARCIFAVPAGSHILKNGEEVLLTLPLTDKFTIPTEGEHTANYDFILGFTGGTIRGIRPDEDDGMPNAPKAADLLNPDAVDAFIENTHAKYHARLGSYFGTTIIGFRNAAPVPAGRCADMTDKLPWTYDLLDDFRAEGGDESHLAALLLPTTDKRKKRDGVYIYHRTIRRRMGSAYYSRLSDWCVKHGVALMGYPADDCDCLKYFDVPGGISHRRIDGETTGEGLSATDAVLTKCAADTARHMGASRAACQCFGGGGNNPWAFTADDMFRELNFLFARGINMIHPNAFHYALAPTEKTPDVGMHSIWWENYKPIAGYIKRMGWLNTMNHNNPCCAVLCSGDFIPMKAAAGLFENGYTFNYITMDDVMNRAHIHDGKLMIDRYQYDILLVDSRLRLTPAIVLKLGRMVTEGGKMYRGNDFLSFIKKNVKKTSYFQSARKEDPNTKHIRFVHLTKSGYPFFLCFNEGNETVTGHIVTDRSGLCNRFDPFTGEVHEWKGELCPDGIRYPVTLHPNTVVILGINTDVLPNLGKNPEKTVSEIVALNVADGKEASFEYHPAEGKTCLLTFGEVHDGARVTVNGKQAGFLAFAPWELDITPHLIDGVNTVSVEIVESLANRYGIPVPSGVVGCAAEIYVLPV